MATILAIGKNNKPVKRFSIHHIIIILTSLCACQALQKNTFQMVHLPQEIKIIHPDWDTTFMGSYFISKNYVSNRLFLKFLNSYTKKEVALHAKHIFWNQNRYGIDKNLLDEPVMLLDDQLMVPFFEWLNEHRSKFFKRYVNRQTDYYRPPSQQELEIAKDTIIFQNMKEYVTDYQDTTINWNTYHAIRVVASTVGKHYKSPF